jgi:hypothetical protein
MTVDQGITIAIAMLSLIFTVMSITLGFVIKASLNWGKNTEQLASVVSDLTELKDDFSDKISDVIASKEREHSEIKERLTYLERRELEQWRKSGSRQNER